MKLSRIGKKYQGNQTKYSEDIVLRRKNIISILQPLGFESLFLTPEDTNGPKFSFLCVIFVQSLIYLQKNIREIRPTVLKILYYEGKI